MTCWPPVVPLRSLDQGGGAVRGSAPALALAAGNHTSARYRAHYIVPVPTPLLRLGRIAALRLVDIHCCDYLNRPVY